jgi:hypothetical protein
MLQPGQLNQKTVFSKGMFRKQSRKNSGLFMVPAVYRGYGFMMRVPDGGVSHFLNTVWRGGFAHQPSSCTKLINFCQSALFSELPPVFFIAGVHEGHGITDNDFDIAPGAVSENLPRGNYW